MSCNANWIVLVLLLPCICVPLPPSQFVPHEYIVQLTSDLTAQDVLDKIPGASIEREYTIGSVHFASLKIDDELFDPSLVTGVDLIPNIVVEGYQDHDVKGPVCYKQETGAKYWGLTRISHVDLPDYLHEKSYLFNETAECVDIYIMDTGVNIEHETFGGRAYRGYTAAEILLNEGPEDRSGHGTHVAGLAAGRTHGVAKNANIISVKVFNESRSGSLGGILDGFDWISNQTKKNVAAGRKVRNVINMSWGFHDPVWRYQMLWTIIDNLPAVAVAAAGNRGVDACEFAPARFETVITVTGVDDSDNLVYDFGHCVDVLAPAVHILSASHFDNSGEVEKSGTSMAAGYVTGIIARHLGSATDQLSTENIRRILQETSTKGKTNAAEFGTPDLLAHASCNSDNYVAGIPKRGLQSEQCGTLTPPGLAQIQAALAPSYASNEVIPAGPQIRVMGYGSSIMDTSTISVISVAGLLAVGVGVVVTVMCRCREKIHCDQEDDEVPVVVSGDNASVASAPA